MRICIIFQGKSSVDSDLAAFLARKLTQSGHLVFDGHKTGRGITWIQSLQSHLDQTDLVLALVSKHSASSELFAYQMELADQAVSRRSSAARIFPIRVDYNGSESDELRSSLAHHEFVWDEKQERFRSQAFQWRSYDQSDDLLDRITLFLKELENRHTPPLSKHHKTKTRLFTPIGGALSSESKYYVPRKIDAQLKACIEAGEGVALIKGTRQAGKTSLLARTIREARNNGFQVVISDFQKLQMFQLQSIRDFYLGIAEMISYQCDVPPPTDQDWPEGKSANLLFEDFWRREILEKSKGPVLWVCDEFDRLFTADFRDEVCGLMRSWYNARAMGESEPWSNLNMIIAYASEAHLFIRNLNQSPFNIGTHLSLDDFTLEEMSELNRLYGFPLKTERELMALNRLVSGQPFLVHSVMLKMAEESLHLQQIQESALHDGGPFTDHLNRLSALAGIHEQYAEYLKKLLQDQICIEPELFLRLRSAGILSGEHAGDARFRCELYRRHFAREFRANL